MKGIYTTDGFVVINNVGIIEHELKTPATWFAVRQSPMNIFGGKLLTTFDINYDEGYIILFGKSNEGKPVIDQKLYSADELKEALDLGYGKDNWWVVSDHQTDYIPSEYDEPTEDEKTVTLLNECLKLDEYMALEPCFHAKVNPFTKSMLLLYFLNGKCYENTIKFTEFDEWQVATIENEKVFVHIHYDEWLSVSIYPSLKGMESKTPDDFDYSNTYFTYTTIVLSEDNKHKFQLW